MTVKSSQTTTICLVRHGETDWNASGRLQGSEDIELNQAGREQALALAAYLSNDSWDLIVTSPLKRALESAGIIGKSLGVKGLIVVDSLKERNYGKASGLLPEERRARYPDGIYPEQEEFEHLRFRAFKAIETIAKTYSGKRIILVSHGAWINSVLYTLSKGEFGSFKTRLKNGCLNLISSSNDQWTVEFYNRTIDDPGPS